MSKFERVLSDDDLIDIFALGIGDLSAKPFDELVEVLEHAIINKLKAEQEPVMYARTYYGEIDWDEACVTEKNDRALMHATDMSKEDFIKHGYAIIPLYTNPCVSSVSHSSDCDSQKEKYETQKHNNESLVCGMSIEQAEKYIYQLETENEEEYVGRGADAYNHCCDELEGWQQDRLNKGLETGPIGTLVGWMDWAQEVIDGNYQKE